MTQTSKWNELKFEGNTADSAQQPTEGHSGQQARDLSVSTHSERELVKFFQFESKHATLDWHVGERNIGSNNF